MLDQITFLGDVGRLTIEVSGYEREAADNDDDVNWLTATIGIQVPPFSGAFEASLRTTEIRTLYEQLEATLRSLTGTVVFQSMEEDLSLEFKFTNKGSVSITGIARPHRFRASALHFRFESDQSSIGLAVHELASTLRRFPVRQAT